MRKQFGVRILSLFLLCGVFVGTAAAQEGSIYSFEGDAALVSKYIWRGQRLTNDWSFQPAMTMSIEGFSFNAWGTLDLKAVNPGDSLPLDTSVTGQNFQPGMDGLKGKFSEIDYTFSYERSFKDVTAGGGMILYTFPERSASLHSTTELYGTVSFDTVPLAPSATLYWDVDETTAAGGSHGVYFLAGASHTFPINHPVFTGLDLSGTISFVNGGFTKYYYSGLDDGGPHDASFTVSLPITINGNLSASPFVTYSGLLGSSIRKSQYQDPREAVRPTGATYADTVWGGASISLSF